MNDADVSVSGEDKRRPTKQAITPKIINTNGQVSGFFLNKKYKSKKKPPPNKAAPVKKTIRSIV